MEQSQKIVGDSSSSSSTNTSKMTGPNEDTIPIIVFSIQWMIHVLSDCKNPKCELLNCRKMKQLLVHCKRCDKQMIGGCQLCKIFMSLCYFHMNNCQKSSKCVVPFCSTMKHKSNQSLNDLTSKDYEILGLVPVPVPMSEPVTQNPGPSDDPSQKSVANSLEPINEFRPNSRSEPSPFLVPSLPSMPILDPEESASSRNNRPEIPPGQQIKMASINKRPIKFSDSHSAQSASPKKRPKILTGHQRKPAALHSTEQLPTTSKPRQ
ncbi:histone acetyltransferase p300-like isoform X2 [Microplitis mediator]|uniref:histone acetyltransferase p300-like isoform X2 n=1 Tax=Microplitis mediator TaxID=375433 RepID=UPI002555167D|nr:histone acetyltransferase p300-like isoform X2 [Microplitis mediator]